VVPPGTTLAALAHLPPAALRLSPEAIELTRRLGIDTVGELAAMPRAPLVRRFGRAVAERLDQVTGATSEPLDPVIPPEPIAVVRRFAEPIATAEAIGHWLGGLVAELSEALAEAGLGARAIVLACLRVDSTTQALRIGLARPTRDPAHLLRLLARRIEEVEPGWGIDALELHVRRADPLGAEALGPTLAGEDAPDLAPLVDTLANRIGAGKLWRTRPVESDVPERAVAILPPLDTAERVATSLKPEDIRRLDTRVAVDPWHPRWPRPVRLLRRPERIDHVMAELPDRPPARFTWRGTTHRIVCGDGPERVFGEWWRRAAERHSVRDYYRVEDDTGHRFWLFRRGDGPSPEIGNPSWYMQAAIS
jgi:protein ImuB